MDKISELLIGLLFLIGAAILWFFSLTTFPHFWDFGTAAWNFLKGGIMWLIILIGFLFILLGISDLKK